MIQNYTVISHDLAKFLHDNGIEFASPFVYNDEQIINPEIVEKYGGLSDDGYYELTKDCGGELDFNEVYIYEPQIVNRHHVIIPKNQYDAPFITNVLGWLLKSCHIFIDITLTPNGFCPLINENVNDISGKFEYNIIPQDEYPEEIMNCKHPAEMYEKTIKYIIQRYDKRKF